MGIKKRNKVSAEFSMSSLTDIIFLLLIFFMLTSSLVAPNALNLKLPGTSKSKISNSDKIDDVTISRRGNYKLNGSTKSLFELEKELRRRKKAKRGKFVITISPADGTPVEHVVSIMDIALRFDIDAILAADGK